MGAYFRTINAFLEDTCVIVVLAYLLTRGPVLALLFQKELTVRKAGTLSLILGAIGLTEVMFPGARFPYVAHTLIVSFAALNGGLRVGLVTAGVIALGAFAFQAPMAAVGEGAGLFASALFCDAVRRLASTEHRLIVGLAAGTVAQAGALVIHAGLAELLHQQYAVAPALISIPANGFGVMLLQLVVNDAVLRANSETHRLEAERARSLLIEAELTALRARVHPHFLFNALTSIAALCGISPVKAEAAIVRLSSVMRRALEADPTRPLPLSEEIDAVRAYLQIEQDRLGPRLHLAWQIDAACAGAWVPPFAVQTLAENAVGHGIAPKIGPGAVRILVRRYPRHALVAVADNGVGMTAEACRRALQLDGARPHGLQILTQQLVGLYGRRARLRLFSREDAGTLALFVIPMEGRRKC